MSNQPIRNGVVIYFPQYRAWTCADFYKIANAAIFIYGGLNYNKYPKIDAKVALPEADSRLSIHSAGLTIVPSAFVFWFDGEPK